MDIFTAAILVATGIAAGFITTVVGGASVVAFPVMIAIGLPPIVANATTAVAVSFAGLVAAIDDRKRLPRWDVRLLLLIAIAIICSGAGALLLLALPERAFVVVLPLLIGFATLLFAYADTIRRWGEARGRAAPTAGINPVLFAPIAVYGGYFGAGMSIMVLAMLATNSYGSFRDMNVLKNLIGSLVSVVAIIIFVIEDVIAWPPALVMMAGALTGGFIGGRLVRVVPTEVMRWVVIVTGAATTVLFAWRYWF